MSASKNHEQTGNTFDKSDYVIDEIEELMSCQNDIDTESTITIDSSKSPDEQIQSKENHSLSAIRQAQNTSLSLESVKEKSKKDDDINKSNISLLSVKTSNVPGPVGLLPILVRL